MNHPVIDDAWFDRLLRWELGEAERAVLLDRLDRDDPELARTFEDLDPLMAELLLIQSLDDESDGETESLTEGEKAGLYETARIEPLAPPAPGRTRRAVRLLPLAALLLLAVTLLLVNRVRPGPVGEPGAKGAGENPAGGIVLQFLVVDPGAPGEEPRILRGTNRRSCRSDEALMFRYQLDQPGRVHLVRVGGDGSGEVISPADEKGEGLQQPGVYDVYQGGEVLVVGLAGWSGLQHFCAVVTPAGVSASEALERAREQVGRKPAADWWGRVRTDRIDCFQIEVTGP